MPTSNIQLRRLAAELVRLRVAAGLTQEQVSDATHVSRAAMTRIENAAGRPHLKSLVSLLNMYEVTDAKREELLALHRAAGNRAPVGWLAHYDDALPGEYPAYIQFEAEASAINTWDGFIVPGLLQTPGYAKAIIESGTRALTPREVSNRVEARVARQTVLHRTDGPLQLVAVIDEAALRRPLGGPDVLREQLQHLVRASAWPNVTLQVVPESVGGHPGLSGAFSILEFNGSAAVVYLEHISGDVFLDGKDDVSAHQAAFAQLRETALAPDATRELIERLV